jgi:hypothetical protein
MTQTNERPILFSASMVQAILKQRKTQTRRVVKLPNTPWMPEAVEEWRFSECFVSLENSNNYVAAFHKLSLQEIVKCPYGKPGDLLWVRETYAAPHDCDHLKPREIPKGKRIHYAATEERGGLLWRPSIFLPRWASRISLKIADIRVERLQEISEDDARAEGLKGMTKDGSLVKYGIPDNDGLPGGDDHGWHWQQWESDPRRAFRGLWESVNGVGSWDKNPLVWVVDFCPLGQEGQP